MLHTLPLWLAISLVPSAAANGLPSWQAARSAHGLDRTEASQLGGVPRFNASSSGAVRAIDHGRMDLGGGQMLAFATIHIGSAVTGSGFDEQFIVHVPSLPQGVPRPLLVAFHAFGVSQKDITKNTTLLAECAERGWYLLAPLSASGGHFMCDPGQMNTAVAMDWMKANLSIDLSRIYAVGFSMGGGMALNFAARHLDPKRWTFAAIVDHTGAVDLIDTYENDPAAAFVFDFWYGQGTPGSADHDLMRRASLIEWDPVAGQVDPQTDLARNLGHIPLKLIRGSNDPLIGLSIQHDRLDQHLVDLGRVHGPSFVYEIVPTNEHSWGILDEQAACDWLAQWDLRLPKEQRTLASASGYYYDFAVLQSEAKKLTPFTWEVDPVANRFHLSETANMAHLVVFTGPAGLSTTQPLTVTMGTADGLMNKLLLQGYASKPASVSRDGQVLPESHWGYNASADVVTLTEWDGSAVHAYSIQP